jgi:hypothetical protein
LALISASFWLLNLLWFSNLRSSVPARAIFTLVSTWVFLAVFLINAFLVYRGLVRAVALVSYCFRSSSSYLALSVCTSTTILLDLAQMFLELEMAVHVLGNVVVSVLLLVVELLRSGVCSHLVSLPLNVGLDDLESSLPIDDKLRHSFLSCLDSLLVWNLSLILLVHVVFGQVPRSRRSWWRRGRRQRQAPRRCWRRCWRRRAPRCCWRRWRRRRAPRRWGKGGGSVLLVNFVLDTSFTSFVLDHTSECITKYELEVLIERLIGFQRFIPLIDRKESCNDNFLEGLIEKGKH